MTTNNLEYEIILDIKLEHIEDAVNFLNKSNSIWFHILNIG
jgi:hypothetical protein